MREECDLCHQSTELTCPHNYVSSLHAFQGCSHVELQVQVRRREEKFGRTARKIFRVCVLRFQRLLEFVEFETLRSVGERGAESCQESRRLLGQGEPACLAAHRSLKLVILRLRLEVLESLLLDLD